MTTEKKTDKKNGKQKQLMAFLITATCGKLLVNTAKRMIYPFAPALARGLGVGLGSITSIIAVNQASSLMAPMVVVLAERVGYRLLLLFAFMFFSIGMFAAGFVPLYGVVMAAFLIAGLSKSIVDPVFQAIAGKMVGFEKRGMVIGILETAWAGSTLIGLPAAGYVIERFNWQTPFYIIGALSLICFIVILKTFPKDKKEPEEKTTRTSKYFDIWRHIIANKNVKAMFAFVLLMSMANDALFVVYGVWLEQDFHLTLTAIGFGAVFIGLSEICGELLTTFLADRLGLRRMVITGAAMTGLCYAALSFLPAHLLWVMAGIFFIFLFFEFAIVTSMSLATELVPEYRASTMSLYYAFAGIGRVAGALSGGFLWTGYGIIGVSVFSTAATFAGLFVFWLLRSGDK